MGRDHDLGVEREAVDGCAQLAGKEGRPGSAAAADVAETAPGSGVRVNKPGYRMVAAIIKSEEGPHYAKLIRPAYTVER